VKIGRPEAKKKSRETKKSKRSGETEFLKKVRGILGRQLRVKRETKNKRGKIDSRPRMSRKGNSGSKGGKKVVARSYYCRWNNGRKWG